MKTSNAVLHHNRLKIGATNYDLVSQDVDMLAMSLRGGGTVHLTNTFVHTNPNAGIKITIELETIAGDVYQAQQLMDAKIADMENSV